MKYSILLVVGFYGVAMMAFIGGTVFLHFIQDGAAWIQCICVPIMTLAFTHVVVKDCIDIFHDMEKNK